MPNRLPRKKWQNIICVKTNRLKMGDMTNDHLGEMFEGLTDDLNELQFKGENPLVFKYTFIDFGEGKFNKALFVFFLKGFLFGLFLT